MDSLVIADPVSSAPVSNNNTVVSVHGQDVQVSGAEAAAVDLLVNDEVWNSTDHSLIGIQPLFTTPQGPRSPQPPVVAETSAVSRTDRDVSDHRTLECYRSPMSVASRQSVIVSRARIQSRAASSESQGSNSDRRSGFWAIEDARDESESPCSSSDESSVPSTPVNFGQLGAAALPVLNPRAPLRSSRL